MSIYIRAIGITMKRIRVQYLFMTHTSVSICMFICTLFVCYLHLPASNLHARLNERISNTDWRFNRFTDWHFN